MNKSLRGLALGALILAPAASFGVGTNEMAYNIARLLLGAGAFYGAQELHKSEKFESIMSKTNVSVKEWKAVLEIMAGCAVLGLIGNQSLTNTLNSFFVRAPIVAGITMLVTSKTFNQIVSKIPYIGKPIGGCDNVECQGCCNECKARKAMMVIVLFNSIRDYIATAERWAGLVSVPAVPAP
jgi:hypothetical protein